MGKVFIIMKTFAIFAKYKMRAINLILTGMMLLLLALSCGKRSHDPRLERIWGYVSDEPRKAMVALDSIDASELSESDRAFYNLTSIKAKDKAYVLHTSDSLILTVINYYSRHMDDRLYAEALYYGGRVYYDLGDYPTSLKYFQEALDLLPENTPNIVLRGNVLSQAGGLLSVLGLYKESLPYIENSIRVDSCLKDTINMALDLKLLGDTYMRIKDYESALNVFRTAEEWASYVSASDVAEIKMLQAAVCYYKGNLKEALITIRPVLSRIDSISRNTALAYASKIYLDAGVLDTAFMYSKELVMSKSFNNRKTGYSVLLSPQLAHYHPLDSLYNYNLKYKEILEKHFKKQEDNFALLQQSKYNYRVHDQRRQEAENAKEKVLLWTMGLLALLSILTATIFYMIYRHKSRLVELHEALAKLDAIEKSRRAEDSMTGDGISSREDGFDGGDTSCLELSQIGKDEKSLKTELRNKLKSIKENCTPFDISPRILKSRPYVRLQSLLREEKPVPANSDLWTELENQICDCYPDFKSRLLLLTDGDLRSEDMQISMLVRCGFTPKQLAILLGITNGAVTYRRKKMGERLFGEVLDPAQIDDIIRLL